MLLLERLLSGNKPYKFAFLCALFLFFRALSGAGYVEPVAEYEISESPTTTMALNYAHLTNASVDMHSLGYAGFAEYWTNFKQAFLSCPSIDESERPVENLQDSGSAPPTNQPSVEGGVGTNLGSNSAMKSSADARAKMTVIQATDLTAAKKQSTATSVRCLKAHLKNRIGLNGSKWLEVKQEERAFGVSFDGFSSRVKQDSIRSHLRTDSESKSAT